MIKKVVRPAVYMDYKPETIKAAITKSNKLHKTKLSDQQINVVYTKVLKTMEKWPEDEVSVERINELVIAALNEQGHEELAKKYGSYKDRMHNIQSSSIKLSEKLGEVAKETDRSNANVGNNFSGKLLQLAAESNKWYNLHNVIPENQAKEHQKRIYIHDLDSYNLTYNCSQIPLSKMLKNGFNGGEGYIRAPKRISTAADLTCILVQTCQNEQFGGISIENFDNGLAKYYKMSLDENTKMFKKSGLSGKKLEQAVKEKTMSDTRDAMSSVIFNLNSMHSRAGSQIPFSSLNIGIPFSSEAATICQIFLEEFEKGLGYGETPIFPNVIFRLVDGINKKKSDPYYYLYQLACKVSATRMNPTFLNCDAGGINRFTKRIWKGAEFDKNGTLTKEAKNKVLDSKKCIEYMEKGLDLLPVRMGCRTSVLSNINGFETGSGRGNIAPCTINLPRLALLVNDIEDETKRINAFYKELDVSINLAKDNLIHRFETLKHLAVKDIPFNVGQGELYGSENIKDDKFASIEPVLRQGSFAIGYVGLAELLTGLIGQHHGQSDKAEKLAIDILQHITDKCNEFKKQYKLNFSLYATPAESVASRCYYSDLSEYGEAKFKKVFGESSLKGFYTNSSHIPVNYKISFVDKANKEAPLHSMSPAGAIFYVEFDSIPTPQTIEKVVSYIASTDIEYFGLNYSIIYCPHCLERMSKGEMSEEEYRMYHSK